MLEALERCLFHQFEQHTNSNILINSMKKDIKELLIFIDENSIESSSQSEDVRDLWMRYSHFREGVHHGQLGKTAQFWVKYMDKVWLLLRFLRATKTNNFMAHLQCLQELCALFFAMDHQNYARYASACLFSLINLPHSHPGADDLLNNWASVFLGHRFQHQELLLTYQSNKLSIGRQSPKVALSTLAEICRHIIAGVSPDTRELHT
ncbi:hypothetical protein RRG08_039403 [Elysia crispata]|uniref:Uncharacterized protein n=1 Tax=Elysia crispata TaxID=231223 RepID=A0AAE0XW85_9GAST|nr:hypothetical protein RRG08_039403 [Elysia crispata]